MKILLQLAIIFGICVLGDMIASILPFTFPGSILAMVILLLLLFIKIIKPSTLKETGDWLSCNMAFFFIPPNVSIMEHFDIVKPVAIQIILISILSLLATFAVAGYSAELTIWIQKKIALRETRKINLSDSNYTKETCIENNFTEENKRSRDE